MLDLKYNFFYLLIIKMTMKIKSMTFDFHGHFICFNCLFIKSLKLQMVILSFVA